MDTVHRMGRVLIGWASRAGATSDIAGLLADQLRMRGHDVDVTDLRADPNPAARDLVVLGSGVQACQWYPEATSWVSANASTLETTPVAMFNVCLNAAQPAKRDEALGYNRAVATRITPVAAESFAGRYVPEHVSWFKRLFLKTLRTAPQDHVDENAVRAWGDELSELVTS